MIGLQAVLPELRKPPCLVFAPEGSELTVLRGVVMAYAAQFPDAPAATNIDAKHTIAPNGGHRALKSIGDMTLRTLDALEKQNPRQGSATPAIVFTNEESRFVQAAFNSNVTPTPSVDELVQNLASQLATIDLTPPSLADDHELSKAR